MLFLKKWLTASLLILSFFFRGVVSMISISGILALLLVFISAASSGADITMLLIILVLMILFSLLFAAVVFLHGSLEYLFKIDTMHDILCRD